MAKIVWSLIVSAIGIAFLIGSQRTYREFDNSNITGMLFGAALQVVAFILFLYGAKKFFLGELLEEIHSMNQRIPIPGSVSVRHYPIPPAAPPVSAPIHLVGETK